ENITHTHTHPLISDKCPQMPLTFPRRAKTLLFTLAGVRAPVGVRGCAPVRQRWTGCRVLVSTSDAIKPGRTLPRSLPVFCDGPGPAVARVRRNHPTTPAATQLR